MSIYDQFGVRPTINAWGTVTEVGGSLMDPRVSQAMTRAAESFVDVVSLHRAASAQVAHALGVPAAVMTSGAAAGITLAIAGCLTGADRAAARALPRTTGPRDRVLMLDSHRTAYEQQIALTGAEVVHVSGTAGRPRLPDVLRRVDARTAAFFYLIEASEHDLLGLAELHEALAPRGIPVVVDAAGELPARHGIAGLLAAGADLLIVSGGKELRGPQSSGLVLGRADLVGACAANAFPHDGIGRGMKLDKETIVGLATAVQLYAERDEDRIAAERAGMLDAIAAALETRSDVTVGRFVTRGPRLRPTSIPRLSVLPHRIDAATLRGRLLDGTPRVAVGVSERGIEINPQCLTETDVPRLVAAIGAALDGDADAGAARVAGA